MNLDFRGVRNDSELKRILRLPQRNALRKGLAIMDIMTNTFKTKNGTQTLRPLQALALAEIYEYRGALVALGVGEGKTLVSYLAPTVREYIDDIQIRCALLLPARLVSKTKQEFSILSRHWQSASNLNVINYESISRRPNILNDLKPNMIIADESHHLSNMKSGVTKRVKKYLASNTETWFIPMSGTIAKRSFTDWHHLVQWAIPAVLQPLPVSYWTARSWACALDENPRFSIKLGALKIFGKTRTTAREGFGNLLSRTPGVIMSNKKNVSVDLTIKYVNLASYTVDISTTAAYVRDTWSTPDRTEFITSLDLARHLREVSQGFCYEWTQPPPREWLEARRLFSKFVREKLQRSKTCETEKQIIDKFTFFPVVQAWKKIKPTYRIRTRAVWFSEQLIRLLPKYLPKNDNVKTLIWTAHDAVGKCIERRGGGMVRYFASRGLDRFGESINDCSDSITCVSQRAISEGFNLQRYSHNIVLCPPKLGRKWEQLLGRTHRSGQEKNVSVIILGTIDENRKDFKQAKNDALYIQSTLRQPQKLCFAKTEMI